MVSGRWYVILLLLMFCGAMAGSTAGGLKVSRVVLYAKPPGRSSAASGSRGARARCVQRQAHLPEASARCSGTCAST